MSLNPFVADARIASRMAELTATIGPEVAAELLRLGQAKGANVGANLGGVVLAAEAAALIVRHGLGGIEELMLLGLGAARAFAAPAISGFFVGAVGLEKETGNLILGGNMEFPKTTLHFTVHGEGFVFTRAFSRGTTVSVIAIGEAHPCAHCRQYLSEFDGTAELTLIDPLGHRLTMAELYPWPFDPDYLGEPGYVTGAVGRPELRLGPHGLGDDVAEKLLELGRRAHAPYSKCPGALVLRLRDGSLVGGASIESVAFNPTMGPGQAAMIDLAAHGRGVDEIVGAVLGTVVGGDVDYAASTRELLGRAAAGVALEVVEWA